MFIDSPKSADTDANRAAIVTAAIHALYELDGGWFSATEQAQFDRIVDGLQQLSCQFEDKAGISEF